MTEETIWISCGVLRAELEELLRRGGIAGRLHFLDSMLHMVPKRLESELTSVLEQEMKEADEPPIVIVFGDCCPRMLDLSARRRVGRVGVINCAQLLLGHTRYRELMHQESFMLLPEWAMRWREVMQTELGLTGEVARGLMRENRRELVYIDTGLAPVPLAEVEAAAAYCDLPWRVESVKLDVMLEQLILARKQAVEG